MAKKSSKKLSTAKPSTSLPSSPLSSPDIYQIKVTLLDSRPSIWRRLRVPADITLGDLHGVLQVAMGWQESHMHQFIDPDGNRYSRPRLGLEDARDETRTTLRQVAPKAKARIAYEYDFGDSWEHLVEVEKVLPPTPGERYPLCVDGKRAGPPEDCGGVWGYEEFLKAIRDENHPDHEDMLEWIGADEPGDFDPEAFDVERVNRQLRRLR